VETGRVIQRRYLLQRLIEQGKNCAVYQGFDQVLQRPVAVKVPFAEHIPAYRTAIRSTSQFTHPNIIGLYDVVAEAEQIYLVQEYVEGDNFAALLQAQLTPYQVVDIGVQVCHALLYAGSGARKICHGDLTTSCVMRDRRGTVHVNNFALPSDLAYFTAWNSLGGSEQVISDQNLPWGQLSPGRRDDDTRALGLLLYQLLASHMSGSLSEGPPADGRLHFVRNTPPELCEVVARAVIRQHPQHITTPEALLASLKPIAEALEPAPPVEIVTPVEESSRVVQASPVRTGNLVTALPGRVTTPPPAAGYAQADLPSSGYAQELSPSASTVAGVSTKLAEARQAAYPFEAEQLEPGRVNFPLLLGLGILLFALFFAIGFFLAHNVLPLP
jgi:serine/threonine protein kinase